MNINVNDSQYFAVSLCGNDKGRVYVVLYEENGYVFLADGKHRKISAPKKKKKPGNYHDDLNHTACGYGYNTKYHWIQFACGCKFDMESHVDPKDAADDTCTCGYRFSDNADLVTLWVNGCPPIKNFNKNTTEYKLNAYTYKDVKEIQISTKTFDSQATVELPQDLTLKAGENKFEVKVIAENQKNTKTYTLIITK